MFHAMDTLCEVQKGHASADEALRAMTAVEDNAGSVLGPDRVDLSSLTCDGITFTVDRQKLALGAPDAFVEIARRQPSESKDSYESSDPGGAGVTSDGRVGIDMGGRHINAPGGSGVGIGF